MDTLWIEYQMLFRQGYFVALNATRPYPTLELCTSDGSTISETRFADTDDIGEHSDMVFDLLYEAPLPMYTNEYDVMGLCKRLCKTEGFFFAFGYDPDTELFEAAINSGDKVIKDYAETLPLALCKVLLKVDW